MPLLHTSPRVRGRPLRSPLQQIFPSVIRLTRFRRSLRFAPAPALYARPRPVVGVGSSRLVLLFPLLFFDSPLRPGSVPPPPSLTLRVRPPPLPGAKFAPQLSRFFVHSSVASHDPQQKYCVLRRLLVRPSRSVFRVPSQIYGVLVCLLTPRFFTQISLQFLENFTFSPTVLSFDHSPYALI